MFTSSSSRSRRRITFSSARDIIAACVARCLGGLKRWEMSLGYEYSRQTDLLFTHGVQSAGAELVIDVEAILLRMLALGRLDRRAAIGRIRRHAAVLRNQS